MYCINCGKENVQQAKFCYSCGSAMMDPSSSVASGDVVPQVTGAIRGPKATVEAPRTIAPRGGVPEAKTSKSATPIPVELKEEAELLNASVSVAPIRQTPDEQETVIGPRKVAPDFQFDRVYPSLRLQPNRTQKTYVWVKALHGFKSGVTLTCVNLPEGAHYSFDPPIVTPGTVWSRSLLLRGRSRLTVTTGQSVGSGSFLIVGTSGALKRIIEVGERQPVTVDEQIQALEKQIKNTAAYAVYFAIVFFIFNVVNTFSAGEWVAGAKDAGLVVTLASLVINLALALGISKMRRWAAVILVVWMSALTILLLFSFINHVSWFGFFVLIVGFVLLAGAAYAIQQLSKRALLLSQATSKA